MLITEDLNLRVVPEPLCEVLSPEQYEVCVPACSCLSGVALCPLGAACGWC